MADVSHLLARFLHVGSAMLWVGYLAFLAWVLVPAMREETPGSFRGPSFSDRLRPFTFLGPLVLAFGLWLVTASGHAYADLVEPGWGHAILGGIVISLAMMGLEHSIVVPALRDADDQADPDERDELLAKAGRFAAIAAVLGLVVAFLMVLALLGGF